MKRPPRAPSRQSSLFPPAIEGTVITPEVKEKAIAALAALLLAALGHQAREMEAGDEHKDRT
jgi:hypothetical protein